MITCDDDGDLKSKKVVNESAPFKDKYIALTHVIAV